jgi:tripartite-type tricarboxylate transporter receptor subunit TctC
MKLIRRQFLRFAAAAAIVPALSPVAWAQGYPARPVRMIVPYAAGGPNDTIARIIAQKLAESWDQRFYVENIPAGAGNVGTAVAAKSQPDGYSSS